MHFIALCVFHHNHITFISSNCLYHRVGQLISFISAKFNNDKELSLVRGKSIKSLRAMKSDHDIVYKYDRLFDENLDHIPENSEKVRLTPPLFIP